MTSCQTTFGIYVPSTSRLARWSNTVDFRVIRHVYVMATKVCLVSGPNFTSEYDQAAIDFRRQQHIQHSFPVDLKEVLRRLQDASIPEKRARKIICTPNSSPTGTLTPSPCHTGSGKTTPRSRKFSGSSSGDKVPRYKRPSHIRAELKRRNKIQHGFADLDQVLHVMNADPGTCKSKSSKLRYAAEFMRELQGEHALLESETSRLREEAGRLHLEISEKQKLLPKSGVELGSSGSVTSSQAKFCVNRFFVQRAIQDWRSWILHPVMAKMFESFMGVTQGVTHDGLAGGVQDWLDKHCLIETLRGDVCSALCELSRTTSVLEDPTKLPHQVLTAALKSTAPSPSSHSVVKREPSTKSAPMSGAVSPNPELASSPPPVFLKPYVTLRSLMTSPDPPGGGGGYKRRSLPRDEGLAALLRQQQPVAPSPPARDLGLLSLFSPVTSPPLSASTSGITSPVIMDHSMNVFMPDPSPPKASTLSSIQPSIPRSEASHAGPQASFRQPSSNTRAQQLQTGSMKTVKSTPAISNLSMFPSPPSFPAVSPGRLDFTTSEIFTGEGGDSASENFLDLLDLKDSVLPFPQTQHVTPDPLTSSHVISPGLHVQPQMQHEVNYAHAVTKGEGDDDLLSGMLDNPSTVDLADLLNLLSS